MTGSFGPTINLATLESLPVGRMRANRRGCMTRPYSGKIQQTDSQTILKIQFSSMVPQTSWCGGHTERVSTSVDVRGSSSARARPTLSRNECAGRTSEKPRCNVKRNQYVRYRTRGRLRKSFFFGAYLQLE